MPTQQELFLELAQPDENGISKTVSTSEFVGRYSNIRIIEWLKLG